jgi:hypothetical protein
MLGEVISVILFIPIGTVVVLAVFYELLRFGGWVMDKMTSDTAWTFTERWLGKL